MRLTAKYRTNEREHLYGRDTHLFISGVFPFRLVRCQFGSGGPFIALRSFPSRVLRRVCPGRFRNREVDSISGAQVQKQAKAGREIASSAA